MSKKQDVQMKCINCPHYSGVQCHGHGDYWAECELINQLEKIHKNILSYKGHDVVFNKNSFQSVIANENSTCKIMQYEEYKD